MLNSRLAAQAVALLGYAACAGPAPSDPPAPTEPVKNAYIARVIIQPPLLRPGTKEGDLGGLFTASLELGLGDLHNTVGVVGEAEPAVGLHQLPWTGTREHILRIDYAVTHNTFTARGTLCEPGEQTDKCHLDFITATTPTDDLAPGLHTFLVALASRLGHESPSDEIHQAWLAPESEDAYAQRISGRAAAIWYEASQDSRLAAALERAQRLDSTMPVALWIQGRFEDRRKQLRLSYLALRLAATVRPSPVLTAGEATEAERLSLGAAADKIFSESLGRPDDLRWIIPRVTRLAQIGQPQNALQLLAAHEHLRQDPSILRVQADILESTGQTNALQETLERWVASSPTAEPLDRLFEHHLTREHYRDAAALLPALASVGVKKDPSLEFALILANGDSPSQELIARLPGRTRALWQIESALSAAPQMGAPELKHLTPSPADQLARAQLETLTQPAEALKRIERVLRVRPTLIAAWNAKVTVLEKLGTVEAATKARVHLAELDPFWSRSLTADKTAPGSITDGRQLQGK